MVIPRRDDEGGGWDGSRGVRVGSLFLLPRSTQEWGLSGTGSVHNVCHPGHLSLDGPCVRTPSAGPWRDVCGLPVLVYGGRVQFQGSRGLGFTEYPGLVLHTRTRPPGVGGRWKWGTTPSVPVTSHHTSPPGSGSDPFPASGPPVSLLRRTTVTPGRPSGSLSPTDGPGSRGDS